MFFVNIPSLQLIALAAALVFAADARGQDRPIRFFGKETVCFLQVRQVISETVVPVGGGHTVKDVAVSVDILDCLPPGKIKQKRHTLNVFVLHNPFNMGPPKPTQDWFPRTAGKKTVVCFDGDAIPNADLLRAAYDPGSPPEQVWQDCVAFFG